MSQQVMHPLFAHDKAKFGKDAQSRTHDEELQRIQAHFELDVWSAMDLILFEIRAIRNAVTQKLTLQDLVFNIRHRSMFSLWVSSMLEVKAILAGEQWRRQEVPIYLNTMMSRARDYFEHLV